MGADKAVGGSRGVEGVVVEERPSAMYAVRLATGQQVLAHMVGMVKRNFVRLVPGDRVEVELTPHDPTRARITRKTQAGGTQFRPLAPGPGSPKGL